MLETEFYGLLSEGTVQQPGNDREVLSLIVRRQDNRVLVSLGSHDGRNCKGVSIRRRELSREEVI